MSSGRSWWTLLTVLLLLGACGPKAGQPEEVASLDAADLLRNGRQPTAGLLTGGQPTLEQLEAIRDAGVATVINLRAAAEPGQEGEAERVDELGMEYVVIPVTGAEGMTEAKARELASALEGAQQPVLIHCASGNRVGGLLALKAFYVDGRPADEALALGVEAGMTRLEPVVRRVLEQAEAVRRGESEAG